MSVINTNITSMIGQSNLNKSQNALQTSMERLSSGLRINSAKDDAAGQAIANRFTAQITGLAQAQRNANDGISIAQTAEGSLNQINDNLQRIRELSVQAQNGTNSQDDLTSIQNEINQRMDEINRISEETDFNGVRVLAENTGLKIQVGANDGQTIDVGLRQINAQTLGLDGFNVDGSGETSNRTATLSDVLAAGGSQVGSTNNYTVTTEFKAATFSDVLSNMVDGNTVAVTNGDTSDVTTVSYTFNEQSGDFSYTKNVATDTAAAADQFIADQGFLPATGLKSGSFTNQAGNTANFDVNATGDITIGGEQAYWTANGELTTNNSNGSLQSATMQNLVQITGGSAAAGVTAAADSSARSFTLDGETYSGTVAATKDQLSYTATATSDEVRTEVANSSGTGAGTEVTLGSGIVAGTVDFAAGTLNAATIKVDSDGELTSIASFDTTYSVDPDSGNVTVLSNGANVEGTKYAEEIGATVYLNSAGELSTSETSPGDRTENPLAALDAALSQVDSLRSELGAVQNRFEDAITNLNTNETNLAAARSRIEDADYAVEVANMTRAQILQQAGTSVLAQANQIPQNVLSLLG